MIKQKEKEDNHTEFLCGKESVLLKFLSINEKTYNGSKFVFLCTEPSVTRAVQATGIQTLIMTSFQILGRMMCLGFK